MLDIIRSNAQSFGVKVAFGVIILVFVFWGIGSFTETGNVNVVGTVNDEPITYQQFEMAYRNAEEAINQQSPRKKWTAEEKTQLGRQVFQTLVTETLINQEARRNNLDVSPYELRLYVGDMQIFQDEQGRFDPERYKKVLESSRQSPAQFEEDLTRRLLQEKMVAFVSAGSWSDVTEARARFNFLRQKRVIEYIYVPADSEKTAAYAPADADISKYYEEHKIEYAIPQKASVQYIEVDPLSIVKPESVTEEAARAWYERNKDRFNVPESVEVAHILVPVDKNAKEDAVAKAQEQVAAIEQELASGKDFAAVADVHNPPNAADKGGRIGWITRGMTVPAFEEAAFAAEQGVVTKPVRSEFGFHLILVSGRKPASTQTFAEAEASVRQAVAAEESRDKLSDILDALTEDNILGKPLAEAAKARGLEARESGLLSREELISTLKVTPEAAQTIMSTGVNQPLDVPLEAGEKYIIARVVENSPATFKSLDEVRSDVIARLRSAAGLDAAKTELEGVLKSAGTELADAWKKQLKLSEPVDRGASVKPFMPQAELEEAIFKAEARKWLPTVFTVATADGSGALICRVVQIQDPADQEWQQFEGIMVNLTQRERADGLFQAFMENLVSKSKILVRNQDIIDRKNM